MKKIAKFSEPQNWRVKKKKKKKEEQPLIHGKMDWWLSYVKYIC